MKSKHLYLDEVFTEPTVPAVDVCPRCHSRRVRIVASYLPTPETRERVRECASCQIRWRSTKEVHAIGA